MHGYRYRASSSSMSSTSHSMQIMQTIPTRQKTTSPRTSINYFINRRQMGMHPPCIVTNTWGIINPSKLAQHCELLEHLNQVFVNVVYLWQHTNILTAKCMLQLPPGLQSMMKAILNKTGVTTTQQPAYEGDRLHKHPSR